MRGFWAKPWVRKVAAALIFLAVVAIQVFFKNFPWPLDVAGNDKLKTPGAVLATSELILSGATVVPNHSFLSYSGNAWEVADMDFDQAEIDSQTAALLALSSAGPPPSGPGKWTYVTYDKPGIPSGETCRTFVEINVEPANASPGEFHLFQLGEPEPKRQRLVEIKADSIDLVVKANTSPPDPAKPDSLGCWKTLESSGWQTRVRNLPVQFVAKLNSRFRITFVSEVSRGKPSWGAEDGYFKSAKLGPLNAQGVTVRPIREDGAPEKAPAMVQLEGAFHKVLRVADLQVGADGLKVAVTGKAFAKVNGSTVGFDVIDALQKNMEFAALITAGNGLLLAWLHRIFFKTKRKRTKRRSAARPA